MKTLSAPARDEFIERRSRFIGSAFPVADEGEALAHIEAARREFWDASHNVYAYVLRGGRERYSDDGEPQGTAGMPVLNVVRGAGLTDACLVVTRYFGGILLGGGGLVRAYTRAAQLAVTAAGVRTLRLCQICSLRCDYALYGAVLRLCERFEAEIVKSDFGAEVRLRLRVPQALYVPFTDALRESSAGALAPQPEGEEYADSDPPPPAGR